MMPALIVVAGLVAGGTGGRSDVVSRYLTAARNLYEQLDYELALAQLDRAQTQSKGLPDDAAINLYRGVILADLGRADESNAAFRTAVSLDPAAVLPFTVSPKVQEAFETAKRAVNRSERGRPGAAQAPPAASPPAAQPAPVAATKAAAPPSAQAARPAPVASTNPAASPSAQATRPAPAAAVAVEQTSPSRAPFWVAALAGGALVAGGGTCLALGWVADGKLRSGDPSIQTREQLDRAVDQEKVLLTAGTVMGSAGIAALTAALVLGRPAEPSRVAVTPAPGGLGLGLAGTF